MRTTPSVVRSLKTVVFVTAAAATLVATLFACGWTGLWLLLGADADGRYAPMTPEEWVSWTVLVANELASTVTIVGLVAVLATIVTAVGASTKRSWLVALGICCGLVAAGILVLVVLVGAQRSHDVAERARASVSSALASSDVPVPVPEPEPTPPAPMTTTDARAELVTMLDASIEAASAPVVDIDGEPFAVADVAFASSACGETGAELSAAISFATSDNALSLTRILAAWDAAGYAPDRAMQEDLRYSTDSPVAWMSIRDRSTIDGLIHMQVRSACVSVE